VLSTLSEVAALRGYIRPGVHEGSEPEIREGRHPVVEQLLKGERHVPNDMVFEKGEIVPGGADRSYGIHAAQLAGLPASVIQRANEIMAELEKSSGRAMRLNPHAAYQASLFPETNPLLDELKEVDVNSLPPSRR
jgi:DNA mismatch repair ATPase MutS